MLPLIDEPLLPLLVAGATGRLRQSCDPDRATTASSVSCLRREATRTPPNPAGVISGIEAAERLPGVAVYHAGTSLRGGQLVTAGGRVLTVAGRGTDFVEAISRAYAGVDADLVRRHAVPARHRTKGTARTGYQPRRTRWTRRLGRRVWRVSGEVFRHHLRLSRQPGRFAECRGRLSRAWRDRRRSRRGRHRRREHVFGHGKRRSGGAPNHPAHRANQSSRPDRCHRLLRDPSARRGGRSAWRDARRSERRQAALVSSSLRFACQEPSTLRQPIVLARERGVAAPSSSPASPAERRSRCGCRPDAPKSAPTASSRRRAAGREACRFDDVLGEVERVTACGLQGDRVDRSPSGILWPRSERAIIFG